MIKLQQLTKRYSSKTPFGITGINLELEPASFTTLIGPSGSGKSTLLKCIKGILEPDEGKITIDNGARISLLQGQENIPQENTVFDFLLNSIQDEISVEQKTNLVRTTLGIFEMTTEINKKPFELSSGQYQRVILSKALISNPDLLLMDEPFSHLDQKLKSELQEEFFNILQEKKITLLWATHDLNSALKWSQNIAVLNLGKIEQFGSPAQIYQNPKNIFVADLFPYSSIFFQEDQYFCYRPESFKVLEQGKYSARIIDKQFLGHSWLVKFKFKEQECYLFNSSSLQEICFDLDETLIYPIQEI